MLAPTPCLEGCGEHAVYQGRCKEHQKPKFLGSTRSKRLPPDWATRRQIVFKRDGGICYLCGNVGADTIDHIVAGDDHSLTNLAPVHDRTPPHCHRAKTSQEGNAAQAGNRTKRRF
jgi:5-methylcytosine-specific restriction protein A